MNYQALLTLLADSAYTNLSASDAATALNAATVSMADNTLYTWRSVARVCGLSVANTLKTAMETMSASQPSIQLAVDMLGEYGDGGGVSFADSQVVAMIEAFASASVLTTEQATALKYLGVSKVSPAANAGLGTVTKEDVLLARAAAALAADAVAEYPQDELRKAVYADLTDEQVAALWNAEWPGIGKGLFGRTVDVHDVSWARQQINP